MARNEAGWRAAWSLALACGCGSGSAAAPTGRDAGRSASMDATSALDATATDASGDDGAARDDDASPPLYEGGLAWDGCASTGTCPPVVASVLASGQASPGGIAVDATSVYWVNLGMLADGGVDGGGDAGPVRAGSQIMKCAKAGCGGRPTVLAEGGWDGMSKLAVDATSVYWLTTGQVLACPLDGCAGPPRVVWSGTDALYDIAVDSTGVYFTVPALGQLLVCPGTGCTGNPTPLWPQQFNDSGLFLSGSPGGIALDATNVYFLSNAAYACDKANCGGTIRRVASSPASGFLGQIAVDDANVYVTNFDTAAAGGIFWAPKASSDQSLSVLLQGLSEPTAIAADGAGLYFSEEGSPEAGISGFGRLGVCAATGCGNRATTLAGFVNYPLGVAVDTTRVYWTDFGAGTDPAQTDAGRVMARAK
ncbi:MAG: hypothetical protein ACHQNA_13135 [Acidimicrobiales bacterium]